MDKIKQSMNLIDAITGTEPQEVTEQRRRDNIERREEEHSDRQQGHIDSGMCESDF